MHTTDSILSAIRTFLESRPGFDWRNYQGAPEAYRADCTTALRGLHDGRALLRACALANVSVEDLRAAACRALVDALARHYAPSVPDRAALLRLMRNVLGARMVRRWAE